MRVGAIIHTGPRDIFHVKQNKKNIKHQRETCENCFTALEWETC